MNPTPTSEQISTALAFYLAGGGVIESLPDEVAPLRLLVGAEHGIYESLLKLME